MLDDRKHNEWHPVQAPYLETRFREFLAELRGLPMAERMEMTSRLTRLMCQQFVTPEFDPTWARDRLTEISILCQFSVLSLCPKRF